jgi:hypothetical protein
MNMFLDPTYQNKGQKIREENFSNVDFKIPTYHVECEYTNIQGVQKVAVRLNIYHGTQ